MKPEDIITAFELYVDDTSDLAAVEELALLQKVFNKVWTSKPWEFAKTSATGSFALTTPNIPKPANFSHFLGNNTYTDNSTSIDNNAAPKVIFLGANYSPCQIINWSDRRQYRNQTGFAYLDLPNSGITFTYTPTAIDTYEFDYKTIAPTLVIGVTIPSMPTEFQPALYHGMAIDNDIIQRFPKAQSYAQDNLAKYTSLIGDMALWNANLRTD